MEECKAIKTLKQTLRMLNQSKQMKWKMENDYIENLSAVPCMSC